MLKFDVSPPGLALPLDRAPLPRGGRVVIEQSDGFEALLARPVPLWKDALDFLGSLMLLVLLSPLLAVIACAVRLTSPGPAIYRQNRAGFAGRPFTMYKFRSMVADADRRKAELMGLNERQGPAFKVTNDPRITGLGRLLRKLSLDELPQLYNVLKGDMSLVGPRPLPVSEDRACDSWHRIRHSVKPGLTCYWQICLARQNDFAGWVRQDIRYIRECSFWCDVRLILQTVPALFRKKCVD